MADAEDLGRKLAAVVDCLERSDAKDAASVRARLSSDYPELELTGADVRALLDRLDEDRLLRVLRDASSTAFVLRAIRVLLDRYGADELRQMILAMR